MINIIFSVHDGRTLTGYRFVSKYFDSMELALDYMHTYHNRATGYYTTIEDGKVTKHYDKIGVIL